MPQPIKPPAIPATVEEKQDRDSKGRFLPGHSGNPAGKKPGTIGMLKQLQAAADRLLPELIAAAEGGDPEARRFILERALPKLKPLALPEPFALPEGDLTRQLHAVLRHVAGGDLSPDTGEAVGSMLSVAARIEEIDVLRAEVQALKKLLEAQQ